MSRSSSDRGQHIILCRRISTGKVRIILAHSTCSDGSTWIDFNASADLCVQLADGKKEILIDYHERSCTSCIRIQSETGARVDPRCSMQDTGSLEFMNGTTQVDTSTARTASFVHDTTQMFDAVAVGIAVCVLVVIMCCLCVCVCVVWCRKKSSTVWPACQNQPTTEGQGTNYTQILRILHKDELMSSLRVMTTD